MPETPPNEDVLLRLRSGDQSVAPERFERFATRLVALARSRIYENLNSKVDAEDVVQTAFSSYYYRQAQHEYELVTWDSLWGLLALITIRKCGRQYDRSKADRRGSRRELTPASLECEHLAGWEPNSTDPTPSQVLILQEMIEQISQQLTRQERMILLLTLQGHSIAEISAQVLCSIRTVQRTLKYVRSLAKLSDR